MTDTLVGGRRGGNSSPLTDTIGAITPPPPTSTASTRSNPSVHGYIHTSLKDGFPNYTLLLDEYEEVLIAKMWMEDMLIAEAGAAWRYAFYALKGEGRRKGKSGWKHWRKTENLDSKLVAKMKVSSILSSNENDDEVVSGDMFSVLSEFTLYSIQSADGGSPSSLIQGRTCSHNSSYSSQNYSFSNPVGLSSPFFAASSSQEEDFSARYLLKSLLPQRLLDLPHKAEVVRKNHLLKWNFGLKRWNHRSKTCVVQSSHEDGGLTTPKPVLNRTPPQSELAALIIQVPLEIQDAQAIADHFPSFRRQMEAQEEENRDDEGLPEFEEEEQKEGLGRRDPKQAKITVILPAGKHGRPHADSNGPPPLIQRWREGGRCDCKGWDLGCGLIVLSNLPLPDSNIWNGIVEEETIGETQSMPLNLYLQEKEDGYAALKLLPLNSGLISLEFRAPLSPLQAFAVTVAILHGRDPTTPIIYDALEDPTETSKTNKPLNQQQCQSPVCIEMQKNEGEDSFPYLGRTKSANAHLQPPSPLNEYER